MRGISQAVKQLFALCDGLCANEAPRHTVAHVKGTLQRFAGNGKVEGKIVSN
jgi:hypothetical protein